MRKLFTMRQALGDPALLAHALPRPHRSIWQRALERDPGDTWARWRAYLIAAEGEPLEPEERELFLEYSGGKEPPTEPATVEVYAIGRRSGKDQSTAVKASYLAACCSYPELAPGERGVCLIIAADQSQATVQLERIRAILEGSPRLSQRIVNQTADTISLDNQVDIVVRAANYRRLRGQTCIAVICSEVAFWYSSETSANPDSEVLRAVRPSLLTVGGRLAMISSPYSRVGEFYEHFIRNFGPGKDPRTIAVLAPSLAFNPVLPKDEIDRQHLEDPEQARSEYLGEWRDDVSAFVSRDALTACIDHGIRERGPQGVKHFAFVDPSGGSSDSMTMAVGHWDPERKVVMVDSVREVPAPFSPEHVVHEFCSDLRRYMIKEVVGDRYAGEWPREQFRKQGITYKPSDLTKSELYLEFIPVLNQRGVRLLDLPKVSNQFLGLVRHTGRSGKDSVDHRRGAKDDAANAVAGVCWLVNKARAKRGITAIGIVPAYGGAIAWRDQGPVDRPNPLSGAGGRHGCIASGEHVDRRGAHFLGLY